MFEADYFEQKRRQLGMDRADVLASVQAWCEARYPGQVRAQKLHQGTLRLVTPNASVAGDLRMRQVELLAACGLAGTRLAVQIASLG